MEVFLFEDRREHIDVVQRQFEKFHMRAIALSPEAIEGNVQRFLLDGASGHIVLVGSESPQTIVSLLRSRKVSNPLIVLDDAPKPPRTIALLESGADDVMRWPPHPGEVEARVRVIQRRMHGSDAEGIVVGEITGYLDGRHPLVNGETLMLSDREADVFQYLLTKRNQLVTRQALYESIYGLKHRKPMERIIDNFIMKLRKKISTAAESGHDYIETIRHRGYQLVPPPPRG